MIVCLLIFGLVASAQAASTPLNLIQSGSDRALEMLRSALSGQGPSLRQRKSEILQIVDEYFNFHEMAKRALGRPWKDQSPEKQKEFVQLFKQLLFNTYINRVETYTGSNEKFVYDEEKVEGDYALVKTRIIGYKNTDVQIDYRLRRENNQWKAYDVVVEGISLVSNYRQQFESILSSGSFDTLLQMMRERISAQG
jgi:phospholipid transport system substrate-binding protein